MLVELRSDQFQEKSIRFHSGLNVVLGDSSATNSIGKSTLLMVIDFIFGGETFLEHNKDVVRELGDHDYNFSLKFGDATYYFRRGTFKPDLIYTCNDKYEEKQPLSIEEYKTFLYSQYLLTDIDLSFRSIVSLFSRIWGKENLDVKHPLHSFKSQNSSECITNTIKLFKLYGSINTLSENAKRKGEESSTIGKAFKEGLIPRISKTQYNNNLSTISEIHHEIEDIKKNLAKYAINIAEVANKEVMQLKTTKDSLLSERFSIECRLARVGKDLSQNRNVTSKNLSPLIKYFPNVNLDKIEEIESFHSKITKILRAELKSTENDLKDSLQYINSEIKKIDEKLASIISNIENPSIIIDRVYELSKSYSGTSSEIQYFETDTKIKAELKDARDLLSTEKLRILAKITDVVNDKIRRYVTKIYNEDRRSPTLHLGQNSYTFEVIEDTGTGKAYSNLILLDLAFLEATALPFLIHDSILFKNIQNDAVAELIALYESIGKQTFIAIDEIEKYGKEAEQKLKKYKVLELSNNKVLYIKDWRK